MIIRSVTSEKGTITYELQHKSVKNLNLRIRSDGSVFVSVPKNTSLKRADEFVKKHIEFITKHQSKISENNNKIDLSRLPYLGEIIKTEIRQREKAGAQLLNNTLIVYIPAYTQALTEEEREEFIANTILNWRKNAASRIFPPILEKAYQRFLQAGLTIPYPTITVKTMKTRWGSCTPLKKKITLNSTLTEKKPICIEYVICHELAHFLQQNHSEKFYEVLDKVMPDHRELKHMLYYSLIEL